jgi:hypothetical protein
VAEPTGQLPVSLIEELRDAAEVAYKGPNDTDKIRRGYPGGGGNLTAAVARVLDVVADALLSQPTPSEHCLSTANHTAHEWGGHEGQAGTGYQCPGFTPEPPRIEDMVPGTTFRGRTLDGALSSVDLLWFVDAAANVFSIGAHHIDAQRIDSSTIRDVTPPAVTS